MAGGDLHDGCLRRHASRRRELWQLYVCNLDAVARKRAFLRPTARTESLREGADREELERFWKIWLQFHFGLKQWTEGERGEQNYVQWYFSYFPAARPSLWNCFHGLICRHLIPSFYGRVLNMAAILCHLAQCSRLYMADISNQKARNIGYSSR